MPRIGVTGHRKLIDAPAKERTGWWPGTSWVRRLAKPVCRVWPAKADVNLW